MPESSKLLAKTGTAPLMLCHYLSPAAIVIAQGVPKKENFLNELIQRLVSAWDLKEIEKISRAVWNREKEGHTVLENGLAIPHARTEGLDEIKACLGLVPEGYPDPQEGVRVRVVFLFLSPQEQFASHLQMLAKISRVFQDVKFIEKLVAVKSPEEAFQLIQRKERSQE